MIALILKFIPKPRKTRFISRMEDIPDFRYIIITICRSLFTSQHTNFWVKFIRRQTNAVAHALGENTTLTSSPVVILISPIELKLLLLML